MDLRSWSIETARMGHDLGRRQDSATTSLTHRRAVLGWLAEIVETIEGYEQYGRE